MNSWLLYLSCFVFLTCEVAFETIIYEHSKISSWIVAVTVVVNYLSAWLVYATLDAYEFVLVDPNYGNDTDDCIPPVTKL